MPLSYQPPRFSILNISKQETKQKLQNCFRIFVEGFLFDTWHILIEVWDFSSMDLNRSWNQIQEMLTTLALHFKCILITEVDTNAAKMVCTQVALWEAWEVHKTLGTCSEPFTVGNKKFPIRKSARFIRTKLILICNLPPFITKNSSSSSKNRSESIYQQERRNSRPTIKMGNRAKINLVFDKSYSACCRFLQHQKLYIESTSKNEIWTEHRFLGQLASFNISKCPPHNQILLRVIRWIN